MFEGLTYTRFCRDVLALKLTAPQRVFATVVYDRIDPSRLSGADRMIAQTIFGEVDEIPARARRVSLGLFGRGSGKDELGGSHMLYRMLTADCSTVGVGDIATGVIIAPDKGLGTLALRRSLARARSVPEIARLLERETATGFELRRPDGRLVALEVLAASHAGSSARGRSILGALLSEAAFFRSDEAAVADAQIFNAIIARLMKGGIIELNTTPWAETGLVWTLYEANRKQPVNAIVAQASSVFMRPDDADLAERVAIEEDRDPVNAAREYGAQFVGVGSSGFFAAASIDACVDDTLTQATRRDPRRAQDIAWDLGFNLDSSALAIVAFDDAPLNPDPIASLVHLYEMTPRPGAPLSPTEVVRSFARIHHLFDQHSFLADQFNAASIRETAGLHKLVMRQIETHKKLERHQAAKFLFDEKRVRIPRNPRLIQQFKDVVSKPLPGGGLKIYTPRRIGRAHGDLASAAIVALSSARACMAVAPHRARAERDRLNLHDTLDMAFNTVPGSTAQIAIQARIAARRNQHIPEQYSSTRGGPSAWARIQWEEKQRLEAEIAQAMGEPSGDPNGDEAA